MKRINLDPLSDEQIAQVLRQKPATKRVEFAGQERWFYFGGLSYDLAERFDTDLQDLLDVVQGTGEDARTQLDAMVNLIYIMMAPFETCPEPALVKLHVGSMGRDEAQAFVQRIMPDSMQDETGRAEGNAPEEEASQTDAPSAPSATASVSTTTASAASTNLPSD